jgi:hypothetical protein
MFVDFSQSVGWGAIEHTRSPMIGLVTKKKDKLNRYPNKGRLPSGRARTESEERHTLNYLGYLCIY